MKLSIIIPAHNEEHRLPPVLKAYAEFFTKKYKEQVELIVVVNDCSDNTEAVALKVADSHPQVRVLVEPSRIGKGGAVELGMRRAKGDVIGFVDADGASSPAIFFKLLENIRDVECIIGSRWIEGAVVSPKQSWVRRMASRILNKVVVHGLFGLAVYDSQCGVKLFRREVLEKVLSESIEPGWAFDIDLLYRIKRCGYGILEFPIEWHHVPGNPTTFMLMSLQMINSVWQVKKGLDSRVMHREEQ